MVFGKRIDQVGNGRNLRSTMADNDSRLSQDDYRHNQMTLDCRYLGLGT